MLAVDVKVTVSVVPTVPVSAKAYEALPLASVRIVDAVFGLRPATETVTDAPETFDPN